MRTTIGKSEGRKRESDLIGHMTLYSSALVHQCACVGRYARALRGAQR
jgi:hypothetical protein